MKKALIVWLVAIVGLIAYDINMVACNNVPGDTLSEAIWALSLDPLSMWIGFGIGVVMGHLFWQRR